MTLILESMEQGSAEWHEARRGRITMSNAKALITGGKGLTRKTYIMQVASEILTGVSSESFKSWDMERGNILEPYARMAYEQMTGLKVHEIGLGYLDENKRISASPDGLGFSVGMEIKCQKPKNHLSTLINGVNPKEFEAQMQGGMWLFDRERWDYVSFCPEFKDQPLFIHSVHRDEEMISRIEESAQRGVEEVDAIVKSLGGSCSDEIKSICTDALEMIEQFKHEDAEIF